MLSECPEGYYGESCAEKCMCMNGASCDSETGSCICKTGWRGRLCGKGSVFYGFMERPLLRNRIHKFLNDI